MKETKDDVARLIERMGKEIGSGITKHTVLDPQTKEDREEIKRLLGRGTMRERLERIEAEALEELSSSPRFREAAEKRFADLERRPDFTNPLWPQDWPGAATILCAAIEKLGFEPFSDAEWFAAKIAQAAHWLKAVLYVEDGSYASPTARREIVAEDAMKLAALRAEWEMKKKYERMALRHEAGGAARRASIEERKARAIEMAQKMLSKPGMRIGRVRMEIARELHRSPETVKEWLKEAETEGKLEIPERARRPGPNSDRT